MDESLIEFVARELYDKAVSSNQEFLEYERVRASYYEEAKKQLSKEVAA